jgi:hypothetical protein
MKPVTKKTPAKKPIANKTPVKKPIAKKVPVKKPAAKGPKAAQFGFGAMAGGPSAGKKKGGKPTTFANAMESMNNLMGDLEMVDTKDSKDFLSNKEKKEKLLN